MIGPLGSGGFGTGSGSGSPSSTASNNVLGAPSNRFAIRGAVAAVPLEAGVATRLLVFDVVSGIGLSAIRSSVGAESSRRQVEDSAGFCMYLP